MALDLRLVFPDGNRLPIGTAELTTVHRAPDGAEDFAGPIFDPDGRKSGRMYFTVEPPEKRPRGRPKSSAARNKKMAAALAWATGWAAGMGREEADVHAGRLVVLDPRNVRRYRHEVLKDAEFLPWPAHAVPEQEAFRACLIAAPEIAEGPAGELRISGMATRWKAGARVTMSRVNATVGTYPPSWRELIGTSSPLCLIVEGGQ